MEKTYRQSIASLIVLLSLDFVLCLVFIGFITGILHIIAYLRNSLSLTKHSVILNKGMLITSTIEIPYSKINSVSVKRGLLGGIFGYGNIAILTGNDVVGEVFKGIDNPDKIRSEILSRTK